MITWCRNFGKFDKNLSNKNS